MFDVETVLLAGFALGLVHSLEPDHLAAMATLVAKAPQRPAREFTTGAAWAAGHALALGGFGAALGWLGSSAVVAASERPFEAAVGVALLYLGFVRLRDARRGPHQHHHAHGALTHAHVHLHPLRSPQHGDAAHAHHSHAAVWLGILHGLAGSGGLLVVMPALVTEDAGGYFAYVAAFGLGSVVSMGAFCGLLARFAAGLRARSERAGPWVAAATGTLSLGVGTFWLTAAVLP